MEQHAKSYIYALAAVFFWATIPTAFKTGLGESEVIPLLTIASISSTVILLILLIINGKVRELLSSTPADSGSSLLLGLLNPFIYYIILLKAYQLLPAQVAQPLNMIWPVILVFLSVPLLRQKIGLRSFVALFISFIGVYIISSQGSPLHPGRSNLTGVLLATGSSFFWALYFIINVRDKRDESVKLFLNFLFGSIFLIILMLAGGHSFEMTQKGFLAAVYIGFFEMGITFFLWLKALSLAKTTDKVSNLVYLAPFLSLIFIHFILHEPVYYTTPAGLILIIGSIWYQNLKPRRS